jgi:site-specific DNA recombinase
VLTRTTYIGRHRFNTKFWKTRGRKPDAEAVEMAVPPIIEAAEFEAVQAPLKSRSPDRLVDQGHRIADLLLELHAQGL